jgi:hypothetical protein
MARTKKRANLLAAVSGSEFNQHGEEGGSASSSCSDSESDSSMAKEQPLLGKVLAVNQRDNSSQSGNVSNRHEGSSTESETKNPVRGKDLMRLTAAVGKVNDNNSDKGTENSHRGDDSKDDEEGQDAIVFSSDSSYLDSGSDSKRTVGSLRGKVVGVAKEHSQSNQFRTPPRKPPPRISQISQPEQQGKTTAKQQNKSTPKQPKNSPATMDRKASSPTLANIPDSNGEFPWDMDFSDPEADPPLDGQPVSRRGNQHVDPGKSFGSPKDYRSDQFAKKTRLHPNGSNVHPASNNGPWRWVPNWTQRKSSPPSRDLPSPQRKQGCYEAYSQRFHPDMY